MTRIDAARSAAGDRIDEHEVVVVGARCAGASTAMLLAQQGHDVLVVDRATFPSDTLSTHAISRGGVVQLARWGLLDEVLASGAPPIREVTFHLGDGSLVRRTVKDQHGVDHLVAPRRHVLDTILLRAAERAGARVETGVTMTRVLTDAAGRVVGAELRDADGGTRQVRSRLLVGADGVRSRVARAVGARLIDERPADGAVHYAYVAGIEAGGFEFHLGEGAFAGIFPTNGGEVNLWICSPADAAVAGDDRTSSFLARIDRVAPLLAARVRQGEITSRVRGAVRFPNHVREATGAGWALVGDAGHHRDPITGHGITDAFRDAELLAGHAGRALRGEVPEERAARAYEDERYRALAPIFELTCRLAQYPPAAEFSRLQKDLSRLIDVEAEQLAGLPPLPSAAVSAVA